MLSISLLLLGFLTFAFGASQSSPFPEYQSDAAREYVHAVIREVEAHAPVSANLCFLLARVRSQLGEKEEAERLAWHASELDPSRAEVRGFLAGILILQDRMDEAAQLLIRATAVQPTLPGGYRQLGMALDRLGDRSAARQALIKAVDYAPQDAVARALLGRLLLDQGEIREAVSTLQTACDLDPKSAGAFYLLYQAQNQLGLTNASLKSLEVFQTLKKEENASLDANNLAYNDTRFLQSVAVGLHLEAAKLFLQEKNVSEAERHLRQAALVQPANVAVWEFLASVLLGTKRLSEARTVCETLVRLRPDQGSYRVNLGTVLFELGEDSGALDQWTRALQSDPNQVQALNNLVRFYLRTQHDMPSVLGMARRLIELEPTAASYDLLGWALYANGEQRQACAAAAKALELAPTNSVYKGRYEKLLEKTRQGSSSNALPQLGR